MTPGEPAPLMELLRGAQADEGLALAQLLDEVERSVGRSVREVLGNEDPHADDVVKNTLLRGAQAIGQCRATDERQVYSWFRKIARNCALHELRRAHTRETNPEQLSASTPSPPLPRQVRDEMLIAERTVRARLKGPAKRLLNLRFVRGLSYDEIGTILKIPADTARMRFNRMILRFRSDAIEIMLKRAAARGEDTEALKHYLTDLVRRTLRRGRVP